MTPGKHNLQIYQHATFEKRFTWKDERKRPVNITGWSARIEFRVAPGGQILHTLTVGNGITINPTAGIIDIYIADEVTATFNWTSGTWDLLLTDGSGKDWRLLQGKVSVSPSTTRPA